MTDNREQHFAIEGMHCAGCVRQVEQQVSGLAGVEVADVNLATEQMAVRFDPAAVDEESIAAAVAKAGFQARLQAPEAAGAARRQERKRVELAAQAGAFRWAVVFWLPLFAVEMAEQMGAARCPMRCPLPSIRCGWGFCTCYSCCRCCGLAARSMSRVGRLCGGADPTCFRSSPLARLRLGSTALGAWGPSP